MTVTEPRNEPETEYGVQYRTRNGNLFVRGGYTIAGAERLVADLQKADPTPIRVMSRDCSPWVPVQPDSGDTQ